MKPSKLLPLLTYMSCIALIQVPMSLAQENSASANNEAAAYIEQKNDYAPIINQRKLGSALENQAWQLQLTAKDKDEQVQNTYFRLIKGPVGFSVSASGLAQWTPSFTDAGKYAISIGVTDGDLSSDKELILNVEDVNRLPQWQVSNLASADEQQSYIAQLIASDADNQPLTFSLKSAPKGLRVNDSTLSWLPSYTQAGDYTFQVIASDGIDDVTQTFQLTVNNTNRAPIFISKTGFNLAENKPFVTQLKARDEDKDSQLVYKKLSGPETLGVSDTGLMSFTPGFDDAGPHSVSVAVTDGSVEIIQSILLQVADTNRAPVWQTNELTAATESQAYDFQLLASDKDQADSLQYRLISGPQGLTVNADGLVSFNPSFEQAGRHKLKLSVTDSKQSQSIVLMLTVNNTNRAPAFSSLAPANAKEGQGYRYDIKALDPDQDELTVSLLAGPQGMIIEGNRLSMQPSFEQAGEHAVHLQVSDNSADGALLAEQFFTLRIENTNRAANIISPLPKSLSATENTLWQLDLQAEDVDRDALSYHLLRFPQGMTINNNTLSWKPSFESAGPQLLTVVVNDGTADTAADMTLQVNNTNRLPSFVSEPVMLAKEAENYQYKLRGTDPDRTPLKFSLLNGPQGLVLNDKDNTLTWLPGFQQAGQHNVVVAVADAESQVEQAFTLSVANTNRAPQFPQAKQQVTENTVYEYKANAQDLDEEDSQSVVVTAVTLPEGMLFEDNTLIWTPDFKSAGDYPIVLSATDGDLISEQRFTLTVKNNNRAPVIESEPNSEAHETLAYQYRIQASDADAETLTYRLLSGPKGMALSANTINWMPLYSQDGDQQVLVSVSDGIDTTQQAFSIRVKNANRTPSLEPISAQTAVLGEKFKYQLLSNDVDGDAVRYKLVNGPLGMSVNRKGQLEYKPKKLYAEPFMVVVQVDDGELKQRRRFALTVISASD